MTDLAEPRSARPTLSPAARALRLQRVFARLQEGASYKDIAAEEGLSRERLRQIVRAGIARGGAKPDHKQMQFARLEPALRLPARGVAEGDAKAIPLLLKLVDRLDRYCEPGLLDASPLLSDLVPRPKRRRRPARCANAVRQSARNSQAMVGFELCPLHHAPRGPPPRSAAASRGRIWPRRLRSILPCAAGEGDRPKGGGGGAVTSPLVMPAHAGIYARCAQRGQPFWIPASARMTCNGAFGEFGG